MLLEWIHTQFHCYSTVSYALEWYTNALTQSKNLEMGVNIGFRMEKLTLFPQKPNVSYMTQISKILFPVYHLWYMHFQKILDFLITNHNYKCCYDLIDKHVGSIFFQVKWQDAHIWYLILMDFRSALSDSHAENVTRKEEASPTSSF